VTIEIFDADLLVPSTLHDTCDAHGVITVALVVTGGVNPRIDGEACAGEDRGAAEAPGLFDGMAIQNDGLSVVSSG
jgi:hypothetical protein